MNAMYEYVLAKRRAMEAQAKALEAGMNVKPKYEYDSDEDTEGGTWEHKRRDVEMVATRGQLIVAIGSNLLSFLQCELVIALAVMG